MADKPKSSATAASKPPPDSSAGSPALAPDGTTVLNYPLGLWVSGTVVSRKRRSFVNEKTGAVRWVTTLTFQAGPDQVTADRWTKTPVSEVPDVGAKVHMQLRQRTFFSKGGLRSALEWGPVEDTSGEF